MLKAHEKTNLMNLSIEQMGEFFASLGEKSFRATQMLKWLYQQGVEDFEQMTNFSKSLREHLAQNAEFKGPSLHHEQRSNDGTVKWLLKLEDGQLIETVFIPEAERGTLCVSSQVGCALDCKFCSTAQQGFNRNLSIAEIIGQLWFANKRLKSFKQDGQRLVTNVVMMGMGEPLLNFDAVCASMNLMMEDNAFGLSKRRVTLSTSGVVPALERLQASADVAIAISLHAPNDEVRSKIVPINKKYPIKTLLAAVNTYLDASRAAKKATIEYVMLDGVNDQLAHADELAEVLRATPCKINLIPFNPFPNSPYRCSSSKVIAQFSNRLQERGYIVTTRKTRGDDIDAACGQLVGKVEDRTRRTRVIQTKTVN